MWLDNKQVPDFLQEFKSLVQLRDFPSADNCLILNDIFGQSETSSGVYLEFANMQQQLIL